MSLNTAKLAKLSLPGNKGGRAGCNADIVGIRAGDVKLMSLLNVPVCPLNIDAEF